MHAMICVSRPYWFWKPPAKYDMPPCALLTTYGAPRIWLNMRPLTNSKMAIRLMAAQMFLFWMIGKVNGREVTTAVIAPISRTRNIAQRIQLMGRLTGGCSRPGVNREIQL